MSSFENISYCFLTTKQAAKRRNNVSTEVKACLSKVSESENVDDEITNRYSVLTQEKLEHCGMQPVCSINPELVSTFAVDAILLRF